VGRLAVACCTVTLPVALSAQAPQLSKEYIRLGDRVLAVASASSPYVAAPVYESWAYLNTAPTSGWSVVGAADFDGNGTPDLVYFNSSTGQADVNYYGGTDGGTVIGWAWLNQSGEPADWVLRAVADMNGDGHPDLLWQNATTGQVTVNYYGGAGGAVYQGWRI
jgi:hypothetical protein